MLTGGSGMCLKAALLTSIPFTLTHICVEFIFTISNTKKQTLVDYFFQTDSRSELARRRFKILLKTMIHHIKMYTSTKPIRFRYSYTTKISSY